MCFVAICRVVRGGDSGATVEWFDCFDATATHNPADCIIILSISEMTICSQKSICTTNHVYSFLQNAPDDK